MYVSLCGVLSYSKYNHQYSGRSALSFTVNDTRHIQAVAIIADQLATTTSPVTAEVMTSVESAGVGLLLEKIVGLKGIYVQGIRVCVRKSPPHPLSSSSSSPLARYMYK